MSLLKPKSYCQKDNGLTTVVLSRMSNKNFLSVFTYPLLTYTPFPLASEKTYFLLFEAKYSSMLSFISSGSLLPNYFLFCSSTFGFLFFSLSSKKFVRCLSTHPYFINLDFSLGYFLFFFSFTTKHIF